MAVPLGSKRFMNDVHRLLADKQDRLPERVRRAVLSLWDEVRDLEQRIDDVGSELATVAREEPVIQALMQIPGFGTLTATALFATVADIHAFRKAIPKPWHSGRSAAGNKADNVADLRGPFTEWLPGARIPSWPGVHDSAYEAGYTTAAHSLPPRRGMLAP